MFDSRTEFYLSAYDIVGFIFTYVPAHIIRKLNASILVASRKIIAVSELHRQCISINSEDEISRIYVKE